MIDRERERGGRGERYSERERECEVAWEKWAVVSDRATVSGGE